MCGTAWGRHAQQGSAGWGCPWDTPGGRSQSRERPWGEGNGAERRRDCSAASGGIALGVVVVRCHGLQCSILGSAAAHLRMERDLGAEVPQGVG